MELLIATNGFKGTWPAIEYGALLGGALHYRITLLGVNEKLNPAQIDDHHPLEEVFSRAVELFERNGLEYRLEVQNGDAEEVIPRRAGAGNFITTLGPLGRPQIRRWLTGRSIRHLLEHISGPIVYVPGTTLPLKNVLVCVGGLGYEVTSENIAIQLASASGAHVTLLHVIPPMNLDYPSARNEQNNSGRLAETDTLAGRALRNGLEMAKAAGMDAALKVRQGNIVEEILLEIKGGEYDLVCMGSPYSVNALRQLYAPNVAAEIMESVRLPVLVARHKREPQESA